MTRLYLPPTAFPGDEAVLEAEASHRLVSVLRLRAGASLRVFDGEGREREATVLEARRERAVLALGAAVEALAEPRVSVTLVCAFPRGQRGDWLVEKATELGVSRLVPLEADRAVMHAGSGRLERWQRIAVEAAEQCGRAVVPAIGGMAEAAGRGSTGSPRTDEDSVRAGVGRTRGASTMAFGLVRPALVEGRLPIDGTVELAADLGATATIRGALAGVEASAVTIYIGPEGGWSEAERAEHRTSGRIPVTLGPRTLRVETAALVALAEVIEVTGGTVSTA